MAQGALFVGWGDLVHGREHKAAQVFGEAVQFFATLQRQGDIESMEVVGLEPHGGDLRGFALLRGDEEKLGRLRHRDDFRRIIDRAGVVVENVGVVSGLIGDELSHRIQQSDQDVSDLVD